MTRRDNDRRDWRNLDPSRVRAAMRLVLPAMALISPLWHSMRKGCARSLVGRVFVEKRWWKMAKSMS